MKRVLILCTGNSCRSIMAEALINHDMKGTVKAYSAGTSPHTVNRRALQVLAELGIETDYLKSKSIQDIDKIEAMDLVVTVCDNAKESCPILPVKVKKLHISFEDPAPYTDLPDDEALPIFRKIRDEIRTVLEEKLRKLLL